MAPTSPRGLARLMDGVCGTSRRDRSVPTNLRMKGMRLKVMGRGHYLEMSLNSIFETEYR
jgi:hypothetical protein